MSKLTTILVSVALVVAAVIGFGLWERHIGFDAHRITTRAGVLQRVDYPIPVRNFPALRPSNGTMLVINIANS